METQTPYRSFNILQSMKCHAQLKYTDYKLYAYKDATASIETWVLTRREYLVISLHFVHNVTERELCHVFKTSMVSMRRVIKQGMSKVQLHDYNKTHFKVNIPAPVILPTANPILQTPTVPDPEFIEREKTVKGYMEEWKLEIARKSTKRRERNVKTL